ncbi:hypothetical protein D9757_009520 [Collybiopsis confluens]|uniref:F-box domain-containing protein n=1 Tax=Collybiopsis confluens TaxID=2823264 RepID=A0A8H5M2T8_9AGAR|nr:hypothetical protein D9757_009520 [Collybiopsis confluens]
MTERKCVQCGYRSAEEIPRIPIGSERFQALRTSNDGLSVDEKRIFNEFVGDGRSKLPALDARIALVEKLLGDLKKAKNELETALTEQKELLHPMRSLPDDVLVEIFKHGSGIYNNPESLFRSRWHSLDVSSAPWMYGHVSRRWRETSINTPVLWTRVKITDWPMKLDPTLRLNRVTRRYETVQTSQNLGFPPLIAYLGRSKASPLLVYFNPAPSSSIHYLSHDDFIGISAILLSHARRFQSLYMGQVNRLDPDLFTIDTFPSLQHLYTFDWTTEIIDSLVKKVPSLRSWRTIGCPKVNTTTALSSIQSYSCSKASWEELLEILQLFPNLRRLRIQSIEPEPAFPPTIWTFATRLSHLKELEIERCSMESLSLFLDNIRCVSLESLHVPRAVGADEIDVSTIQSFEERSDFHLKHWEFITPPLSVSTLKNTALIETIVAKDISTDIQNPILSELTVSNGSPPPTSSSDDPTTSSSTLSILCPKLRRLELHLTPPQDLGTDLTNWDIVEQIYECVSSRAVAAAHATGSSNEDVNISPLEVLLMAPDALTQGIRCHPSLEKLRLLGLRVEIQGF